MVKKYTTAGHHEWQIYFYKLAYKPSKIKYQNCNSDDSRVKIGDIILWGMFLTFDRYLQISWRSVKAILTNWLPTPVYHHPEILCRVVAVTTAITRLFSVTLLPPSASALMLLMVMCCQGQKLLEIQTVLNLVCLHAIDRPTFSIQTEKKCRQKAFEII